MIVLVIGSLATANNAANAFLGQASARWRYTYYDGTPSSGSSLDLQHRETQMDVDSFAFNCAVNGSPTACTNTYGLFSFEIPFTWGWTTCSRFNSTALPKWLVKRILSLQAPPTTLQTPFFGANSQMFGPTESA